MIQRDGLGRITRIALNDPIIEGVVMRQTLGHSVCGTCGKDMPGCWDVVCKGCNRTFCYNHADTRNERWFCLECLAEAETAEAAVKSQIDFERAIDF